MENLTTALNQLLASYQVYYQNLRNFHWNVRGEMFFELHVKFEELYNDAVLKVDEIAERVLTLDTRPLSSYAEFLQHSKVQEAGTIVVPKEMVKTVKENLQIIVRLENNILKLAQEQGDEGTTTILTDYIMQQEKVIWMLKAYLG